MTADTRTSLRSAVRRGRSVRARGLVARAGEVEVGAVRAMGKGGGVDQFPNHTVGYYP
jgi:hypothetical protein